MSADRFRIKSVGTGTSLIATKSNGKLAYDPHAADFKSLAGGTGVSVTSTANTITINVPEASSQFNVTTFGALGNGRTLTDITTTASSAVISSASYSFVAADVGKLITIAGAGAAAARLNTSIASVAANGTATLTVAPSTSIAGTGVSTFGTDDTVAIQAAVTAAAASSNGGLVMLNDAVYIVDSLTWASKVSMMGLGAGKSVLFHLRTSNMVHAVIEALGGGVGNLYTDCQFTNFEIDCTASITTSYAVGQKCIYIQFMLRALFQNLYLHDSPATCLGVDYLLDSNIIANVVTGGGRGNNGSQPGGAGIGIAVGGNSTELENCNVIGNIIRNCKTYAIFFEGNGASAVGNTWTRIIGNFIYQSASFTSFGGIGDCGNKKIIIEGNHVIGNFGARDGITVIGGTIGGAAGEQGLIANNYVEGFVNGISINWTTAPTSAICEYVISNNKCIANTDNGIRIIASGTTGMETLKITDNFVSRNNGSGIYFTGVATAKDVTIANNICKNNGLSNFGAAEVGGISISTPITKLRIVNNICYDNQGSPTQQYGLIVTGIAATGCIIVGNDFSGNATDGISLASGGTVAGTLINNVGYNSVGRVTAQTAAAASVAALTVPASDSSYKVSANVLVTTATTHNFTVTCAYTDEGNTARTATFNFANVGGTIATAIANAGGAVPYMSLPLHIRCKASTTITIATTGTFTTVTYNAEGYIQQLPT